MLTVDYLKQILDYNKNTGVFTWKVVRGGVNIGEIAGTVRNQGGYREISINSIKYKAHRLAWLYEYGVWPTATIDHINGIIDDNRLCNLRDVTQRQNNQNKDMHRNGKLVGAHFYKRTGKYRSFIVTGNKEKHLGYFNTPEEAHEAYIQAVKNREP